MAPKVMPFSFLLKKLPRRQVLEGLLPRYPKLEVSAVDCYMALLEVAGEIITVSDMQLARHKTSLGRIRVLMQLLRCPGHALAPGELAGRIGVTPATVTGLLDGLERERLVRRERCPGDRRSVLVRLTPQGGRFLDRVMPERFKIISRLMARLSETDRRALGRLLDAVSQGLKESSRA
jgi:DNA-binding MarR family transcriptional regulator